MEKWNKTRSKVSVYKCSTYELKEVKEKISGLFDAFGGISRFVKTGDRVFLKPNLLSAKEPERAVTTHPAVLEAVIRLVQDAGGKPVIGDSPAGALKNLQRYWKNTGLYEIAKKTDTQLINYEGKEVVKRSIEGRDYYISKEVLDSDIIFNLCKLKTHFLVLYTGAIKNMFGVIPGLRKAEFHKMAPKPDEFSRVLVDIFSLVPVAFHIMDAILCMDGNGPSSGRVKRFGYLFGSDDGVALDALCCTIMGFKKNEVATTRYAGERGLGISSLDNIDAVGDEIHDKDFILPSNRHIKMIPRFLMVLLGRFIWVKQVINTEKCIKCMKCVQICPVGAVGEKDNYLKVDHKKCIQCNCCDEVCPENAIEQEFSFLAKKIS